MATGLVTTEAATKRAHRAVAVVFAVHGSVTSDIEPRKPWD
jgi:hypothetical protein